MVRALYALLGLVFVPILLIASMISPNQSGVGAGWALGMPILYGVFGSC